MLSKGTYIYKVAHVVQMHKSTLFVLNGQHFVLQDWNIYDGW